jgi:DNA-binding MarR family transcriptional regulator
MGKMGDRLMLHPTSVTNIIDRLERQGLVQRAAHPTDRRTTLAEITDDGRRVVDKATEAVSATGFGMAAISDDDLDHITALLRTIRIDAGDFPG